MFPPFAAEIWTLADLADIGIFGGSGFYSLLDDVREVKIDTPYGAPSDSVFLADGRGPAGRVHAPPRPAAHDPAAQGQLPRQRLGDALARRPGRDQPVRRGSLQRHVEPGHFVVSDQFVDRTTGRADTFFDGPIVSHVSSAEIYDPTLRGIALDVIREHGITVHDGGTVVVIQGPRFSTKAESKWFSDAGWEVINMTQYPEAYLCRELGMAVVNIALITDYDAGVLEGTEAVTAHDVLEVFEQNAERIPKVVLDMVGRFPADLASLGARDALRFTRGDGHAANPPTSGSSRPASRDMTSAPTPMPVQEPLHGCVRCGTRFPSARRSASDATRWGSRSRRRRRPTPRCSSGSSSASSCWPWSRSWWSRALVPSRARSPA